MTTIEIGLTVAVVVLGIGVVAEAIWTTVMWQRQVDINRAVLRRLNDQQSRLGALESREQQAREKAEALALTASEIKARLVMEVTAKQAIEALRKELADLQAQVAGMLVNREVLTPSRVALGSRATGSVSGGSRYGFLPEPSFTPESAAHAATDHDPETAESLPQPNDDEATETDIKFTPLPVCRAGFVPDDEKAGFEAEDLGIEEKAVVDWADAKQGEVA
jgi:hypothetical protein